MLVAPGRAVFISVSAYDTIAGNVSRRIRTASKINLICSGFYADLAKLWTRRDESKNSAEFRLPPGGGLFFE